MKSFIDTTGRTWKIKLTFGTAMAVKEKLGVDLLQPEAPRNGPRKDDPDSGESLLTRLGTDEMLLGEVLCALLEGQFDEHQMTEADVHDAFDGKTLLAAQTAFYEELIDFFRGRGRHDRAKAVAKQTAMIQAAVEAISARIDSIDTAKLVDETMRGRTSGASPAVSASPPVNLGS